MRDNFDKKLRKIDKNNLSIYSKNHRKKYIFVNTLNTL